MAVLAVTHILLLNEVQVQRAWAATGGFFAFTVVSRNHAAEVVGNHAVVGGGVFEGFEDVYKRQVQRCMKGYRLPEPTRWADAVASERPAFVRYTATVSYTHLDVYKRQTGYSPKRKGTGGNSG